MASDYPARRQQLTDEFAKLAEVQPAVMNGFGRMHRAATTAGALPAKTRELMALAIAIAVRCDGCIAFHVHDAVAAGATADEVAETIGVAVMMGGGPSAVYGSDALRAYDQFANGHEPD